MNYLIKYIVGELWCYNWHVLDAATLQISSINDNWQRIGSKDGNNFLDTTQGVNAYIPFAFGGDLILDQKWFFRKILGESEVASHRRRHCFVLELEIVELGGVEFWIDDVDLWYG